MTFEGAKLILMTGFFGKDISFGVELLGTKSN